MEYHQERFDDASVLVFKDKELIAVFPANRISHKVASHQGLSYGGLVVGNNIKFPDVMHCLNTILMFFHDQGINELEIKSIPRIYTKGPSDELDYLMFKLEAQILRKDVTSVIDYRNKLNIASSNRKRGLKKAIKQNLIVKEVDQFDDFWNTILIPNLKKKHRTKPTHSLEEIQVLNERFPKQIRQFNAYKDSKIVAGVTVFDTDNVAHAQYISADENMQELGSLDLIFDKLINSIFKSKAYFDFGISNENQGQNINEGLLKWKEDFGARSIIHNHYLIQTKNFAKLNSIML